MATPAKIAPLKGPPAGVFQPSAIGAALEQLPQIITQAIAGKTAGEEARRKREREDALFKAQMEHLQTSTERTALQTQRDILNDIIEKFGPEDASRRFAEEPGLAQIYKKVYGIEPTVEVTTKTIRPVTPPEGAGITGVVPTPGVAEEVTTKKPRPLAGLQLAQQEKFIKTQQGLITAQARRVDAAVKATKPNEQAIWTTIKDANAAVARARQQGIKMGMTPEEAEANFPSLTQEEAENLIQQHRTARGPAALTPGQQLDQMKVEAWQAILGRTATPEQFQMVGLQPGGKGDFIWGGKSYEWSGVKALYMTDPTFRSWADSQGPMIQRLVLGFDPEAADAPAKMAMAHTQEFIRNIGQMRAIEQQIQQVQALIDQATKAGGQARVQVPELQKELNKLIIQRAGIQEVADNLVVSKAYYKDPRTGQGAWFDLNGFGRAFQGKFAPLDVWMRLRPEDREYLQRKWNVMRPKGTQMGR